MTAYLDTSVLLAVGLDEARQLSRTEWGSLVSGGAVSSRLCHLETLRRLDNLRIADEAEYERRAPKVRELLDAIDLVLIDENILELASQEMPTPVGALDAVHLVTAILVRQTEPGLVVATHDPQLATAAKAHGFRVVGA